MYEKYLVDPESIKNVLVDNTPVGFEFETKIPYYRGVFLSLVRGIDVTYNDKLLPRQGMTFTVDGHTYTFDELETVSTLRWEFGEKAKVFVPMEGGIGMGVHDIGITIWICVSYSGGPRPTTVHHRINIMG